MWVVVLAAAGAALGALLLLWPSVPIPNPDRDGMPAVVARALGEARQRVLADPESAEAWGTFGAVLDAHEMYDDAAACYDRARILAPREFRWAYHLAIVEDFRGADVDRVVSTFLAAIELDPDYMPVHYRYGDALVRQGRLEEARDAYARAVALKPDLALGHRALGQVAISLGDPTTAVRHLERSAQLQADDGKVFVTLARAYTMLGEDDRAAQAEQRSRQLTGQRFLPDPIRLEVKRLASDPDSTIHRAQQAMDRGAFAEAIPDLERFLESAPDHAVARFFLGGCYAQTGRPREARVQMAKAVRLNDGLLEAHVQLGSLFAMEGRLGDAIRHFRRALRGDSDNADVLAKLGLALAMRGDHGSAIEAFEKAVALAPQNVGYVHNLGTALMRKGDFESAVRQFRQADDLRPGSPETLMNLGMALERLGRVDEAIAEYRRASRLDPNHRAARRLRQLEP